MPEEVFTARIQITDSGLIKGMIGDLIKFEAQAVSTAKEAELAFAGMNIALPFMDARDAVQDMGRDIDNLMRAFGSMLTKGEGGPLVGPMGGISGLKLAEVTQLADALKRMSELSGLTILEMGENFEKFGLQVAAGAGVASTHMQKFFNEMQDVGKIVDAVEDIGVITEEALAKATESMSKVGKQVTELLVQPFVQASEDLVGKSIIPEMVKAIDLELAKLPVGAGRHLEKLRDQFLEAGDKIEEAQKQITGLKTDPWGGAITAPAGAVEALERNIEGIEQEIISLAEVAEHHLGARLTTSVTQVADSFDISRYAVRQLVKDGRLAGEMIGGEFRITRESVDRYTASITKTVAEHQRFASAGEAMHRLGVDWNELNTLVDQGIVKANTWGQISQKSIQQVTRSAQISDVAATSFEANMVKATRTVHGFRDGINLIRGGEGLLGLRVALFNTSDSTNKFARGLDGVRGIMDRFRSDLTKEEKALIKNLQAYQEQSIGLRNSANDLKEYAQGLDIPKAKLNQLTEATRVYMNAIRKQTQAGVANREVTAHGSAEIGNSIQVIEHQIDSWEKHIKTMGKSDDVLESYIKEMRAFVTHAKLQTEVMDVQNEKVKEQHAARDQQEKDLKEAEKAEKKLRKEQEKSVRVTSALTKGTKGLSRAVKVTVTPMRGMAKAVQLTNRSMFKMASIFTTVNAAFDLLQEVAWKAMEQIKTFKDEMLGFGVIGRFTDQLTDGMVEFAAEAAQSRLAVRFMGAEIAKSVGIDPQRTVDALTAKMEALQKQGIGVFESSELIKTALTVGFPIGAVNEATNAFLRQDTTLEELIVQMQDGKLGLETLGRAAQNWTAVMGGSSSELAKKMIDASSRMSTEILETNNIQANASTLWENYGRVIGKTVKEMSEQEKQFATLLGIIQQTLPAAGAYERAMQDNSVAIKEATKAYKAGEIGLQDYLKAMSAAGVETDTVGKLIGSMDRYVDNAKLALGDVFLPILGKLLIQLKGFLIAIEEIAASPAMARFADAIGSVVEQMTIANPVIIFIIDNFEQLSTTISSLLEAVGALMSGDVQAATEGFKNFLVDAIAGAALFIRNTIAKAAVWGWNLVANLANGIMDAAQTLLVQAAEFVGSILESFFGPGSPPQKGPLRAIAEWGAGLMGTMGMAMSDAAGAAMKTVAETTGSALQGQISSVFRSLELGSLQAIKDIVGASRGVLQAMVGMGELSEVDLAPSIIEVREILAKLANEFENTGEISGEMLDELAEKFGGAGEDMREYVKLQFELQKAREGLKEIDAEIAAAEAAGFVPAALRARRKTAESRIGELEDQFALQKELISWQQESNNLVKEQVNLLKRIADQQERATLAAEKGKRDQWEQFLENYNEELAALETKRALGLITEDEYLKGRLGLERRYIDTAIRMQKPLSQERLDAYKSLLAQVEALKGGKGKGMDGLTEAGDRNRTMLEGLVNSYEGMGDTAKANIGKVTTEFKEMRENVANVFKEVEKFIKLPISDKIHEIAKMLGEWFDIPVFEWFEKVRETVETVVDTIHTAFKWLYDRLVGRSIIPELISRVQELFQGLVDFLSNIFKEVFEGTGLKRAAEGLLSLVNRIVTTVVETVKRIGESLGDIFTGEEREGAVKFVDEMKRMGREAGRVIDSILLGFRIVTDTIAWVADRLLPPLADLFVSTATAVGIFVKGVLQIEGLPRLFDRIVTLLKVVGGEILILAGAASVVMGAFISIVADALEPFVKILVEIIDLIVDGLIVAIDLLVAPIEVPFRLLTEGGQSARKAMGELVTDIKNGLVPALILVAVVTRARTIAAITQLTLGISTRLGVALIDATAKIRAFVIAVRGFSILAAAKGFVIGAAVAIKSVLAGALAFILSPIGVAVLAIAALVAGIVVVKGLFEDAAEGTRNAKGAISEWSDEALAMRARGQDSSDMVQLFAERVNNARDAFDKGGPLVDVFGKGRDLEIFAAAAWETNKALLNNTDSFDEYLARVKEYNETVEVDAQRITEEFTEAQWNFAHSLDGATRAAETWLEQLERLSTRENIFASVAKNVVSIRKDYVKHIQRTTAELAKASRADIFRIKRLAEHSDAVGKAAQDEEEYGQRVTSALARISPAISQMLQDRTAAEKTFQQDRKSLIASYEKDIDILVAEGSQEEIDALTTKHNEELAEIDRRYAEEKAKRRIAIGEALLDLNFQIQQEKILAAQRTSATFGEIGEIESFHRGRAEAIGKLYDIDVAARMNEMAADALQTYVLSSEDVLKQTDYNFEQAIIILQALASEGYGGLGQSQRELITELAIGYGIWQQNTEDAAGNIVTALGAIPAVYHQLVLDMLDEEASITEIFDAIRNAMDEDYKASIAIEVNYAKGVGKMLVPQSPKTQLQIALENLVEYAKNNPVMVAIQLTGTGTTEGALSGRDIMMTFLEDFKSVDVVGGMANSLNQIRNELRRLSRDLIGSGGIVVRMVNLISASIGTLWPSVSDRVRLFSMNFSAAMMKAGQDAALAFANRIVKIIDYMREMFSDTHGQGLSWAPGYQGLIGALYGWGIDTMEAFSYGIRDGFLTWVVPRLKWMITHFPQSQAKIGPLSKPVDWAYLTSGLDKEIARVDSSLLMNGGSFNISAGNLDRRAGQVDKARAETKMFFERGAFEGAFPGVTSKDDMDEIVRYLDNLAYKSSAYSKVGA